MESLAHRRGGWNTTGPRRASDLTMLRKLTSACGALKVLAALCGAGLTMFSQNVLTPPGPVPVQAVSGTPTLPSLSGEQLRTYILGTGDQIRVRAVEIEEIGERGYLVDNEGYISMPLVGRVPASGKTLERLEKDIAQALAEFVRNPKVDVSITQMRSDPLFLVGAFRSPGVYAITGRRTLFEVLSSIGALQPSASRRIKITRKAEYGSLPLPNAVPDLTGKGTTGSINLQTFQAGNEADLVLKPYDVLQAERAEMVFVNGEIGKVGGFDLGERESISLVQLVTMSGGLNRNAAAEKAVILRPVLNTNRRAEIPVNLRRILSGEQNDFPVMPNDLLYVPRSRRISWDRVMYVGLPVIGIVIGVTR